ncbi:hypothetical protein [Ralstonia psammae]|uniref:hypothetical protein n=1 Tax=Ralstonia psammae TaxID=3058598 RepID=UPI00292F7F86|nr:hypothetical protein [Ralstonia sp. LMG 19083]
MALSELPDKGDSVRLLDEKLETTLSGLAAEPDAALSSPPQPASKDAVSAIEKKYKRALVSNRTVFIVVFLLEA